MERKKILFQFILLLILLPTFFSLCHVTASPAIGSTTITVESVADAYVNFSSPDTNYGGVDYMYVSANSEQDFTYVMFDLSSLPSGANIISAKLKVYLSSTGGSIYWSPADRIGAYYCSDSFWTELGITWNNKASFDPEPTDTWSFSIIYYTKVYKSWNVTEDLRTALPSGTLTEVLKFESKTGDGYAVFQSREGANKPKLEVEYSTKPVFVVHLESIQDTEATVNLGLITFSGYVFSLPTDIDVVNGSYLATYSGGYTFVRWETTGGVTVSDENEASTMVTVLGDGTLRAVGTAERFEYTYDQESPQWNSEGAGEMDAVRFTPLFSGQLLTARYYMYDLSSYQSNTFKVHIIDETHNDLVTPFNATPPAEGWFDVDLSSHGINVNEGADFYLGMEWIVDYNPDLGKDSTSPSDRSWHWNGTVWKEETYSDFMIRAVVGTAPLLPTFNIPVLQNPATLDGVIIEQEWADANRMGVTFETDGITYEGVIHLKHDCTTMWICIQVQDEDEDPSPSPDVMGDAVGVIFDTNGNIKTDAGDDMAILFHDDQPKDMAYTADAPSPPEDDETIGGAMNVNGGSEWQVGVYTFELSKPLNSGDSAGNDIALSPGDEIAVKFIYVDPDLAGQAPPFVGFMLLLEPCLPPVVNVGVEAGDWVSYGDVSFEYASNMPGYEQPPPEMNISWTDMEVLDVSDSSVTVLSTIIFENGTEQTDIVSWGNIATGEGNLSLGIIPSNLGEGDEIPESFSFGPELTFKISINGTVTRRYAGAYREVNYVNVTYPIIYDTVQFGTMNISLYWDKETGIICEEWYSYVSSYTINMTDYYINMSMMFKLTATNMWPAVFTAQDGYAFNIVMTSNSTISDFDFSESLKQISFNVTGPTGKAGCCNVTIPRVLLKGEPWTIYVNNTDCTTLCSIAENSTHTFIYIPYTCSTNTIQIKATWVVPEFPSAIILPLIMILTTLAAGFAKKGLHGKQRD